MKRETRVRFRNARRVDQIPRMGICRLERSIGLLISLLDYIYEYSIGKQPKETA